jgi:hypothetical protein
MTRISSNKFSANEKEIESLLKENESWKKAMSHITQEMNFLDLYLKADIFEDKSELHEELEEFVQQLENARSENYQLIKEVHNHRYDIEGILECEDIGCEVFYHEEHLKLEQRIGNFRNDFRNFKLQVFTATGKWLRKSSDN